MNTLKFHMSANVNSWKLTVKDVIIYKFITLEWLFIFLFLTPAAMGVLMSKKQQVEKVQKCNAVVSAFQAGIKDRAIAKQAEENEAEAEAKSTASPDEKDTEEAEKEETENSAGPSTSQQATASGRDECKVNQEAWSRLRDGKGVEPEDLDKTHQLTPPAYVRPKREADDDQPVEIALEEKEKVSCAGLQSLGWWSWYSS